MSPAYLYITPFFPSPGEWRGSYCLDFVKALKRTRPELRVEVFVCGEGGDYEIDGVKVWRFEERILPGCVLPFLFRKRNERSFLAAVRRAGIAVDDVSVCHGNTARFAIYPLAVKKLNPKCKTLLHHHDLASFGLNLGVLHRCILYNVFLFRRLRALHEKIDCHVFISEASRRSFLSAPDVNWTCYGDYKAQMRGPRLFGCRPARIGGSVVLHNGVDPGVFKPRNTRNTRKRFVVGCVGNFERLKGQMSLLKAVEMVENSCGEVEKRRVDTGGVRVVFVGSGPERAKCEDYARMHRIDAEFRDEIGHGELPDFYGSIDLFVLPSYFEGFGCVYTEARACGTPFIACEGQGIEDLIAEEDRGRWLCRPGDADDLAARIKAYMDNRWEQKLTGSVDIDALVKGFCGYLAV